MARRCTVAPSSSSIPLLESTDGSLSRRRLNEEGQEMMHMMNGSCGPVMMVIGGLGGLVGIGLLGILFVDLRCLSSSVVESPTDCLHALLPSAFVSPPALSDCPVTCS